MSGKHGGKGPADEKNISDKKAGTDKGGAHEKPQGTGKPIEKGGK